MRTLDADGRQIDPASLDPTLGRFTVEQAVKQHHAATAGTPEKGEWRDIDGHPGAQAWIVTVPAVPAREAWDEYETVQRWVPYTADELAANARVAAEADAAALKTAQTPTALGLLLARSTDLTDGQADGVSALLPAWQTGGAYRTGQIVRHRGALYRALQDSTGQAGQEPDTATGLWKRVGEPDADGVYPWSQPLGATDAYPKGALVTHDGRTWSSDIDANVWKPGAYGWTEQQKKGGAA